MKREIKLRAWDKSENQMSYSDMEFFDDMIGFRFKHWGIDVDTIDDIEIMQYTGLKDKNGREIYEGDIVRCSDGRIAKIIWFEFGWYIESKPFSKMEKSYAKMDDDEGDSVILMEARRYGHLLNTEVIGNIYETPELL